VHPGSPVRNFEREIPGRATVHFTPNAPRAEAEEVSISAGVATALVTNAELLCRISAGVAGMAFIYMAVVLNESGTLADLVSEALAGLGWLAGVPGPGGAAGSAAAMALDANKAKNALAAAPAVKTIHFLVCGMVLLIS
jgi:hypothetical protein